MVTVARLRKIVQRASAQADESVIEAAAIRFEREMSLTDQLAEEIRGRIGVCPACGHQKWNTLRGMAKKIGTSPATLSRWLNGGKHPDAETLNKVWAYFARAVRTRKP